MDPTGGWAFKILNVLLIAMILLCLFAPTAWAIGISVVGVVIFVGFLLYVLSYTRYT